MFDLFSGDRRAPHRSSIPVLISTAAHVIVLGAMLAIPILYVTEDLPEIPDMLTFVVSAAPPPPPPPPPPAAPAPTPSKPKVTKPVPTTSPRAAPVEAPREIIEETYDEIGSEEGVPDGVEGGIPGGVVGGFIIDLPQPPPPPPPPAPVTRDPVRVGGDLKAPALVERVEPEYPPLAVRAKVEGVVILEALVDLQGRVESVRVLRSIPLLDNAAIAAVRQWRYSPLLLNGQPERFVLTVTLSFSLST